MASSYFFAIAFLLNFFPLQSETAETTTVELTTPVHAATIGGILAIQCQVWKMQDGYTVNLYRVLMNGRSEQITFMEEYNTRSSLGQRGFVAKRTFSDGSIVLFLTVIDISSSDHGTYLCKVDSDLHGNFVEITRDSIEIDIYTFPSNNYPLCSSAPNTLTLGKSEQLILTCTSEKGSPVAELNWICSQNDIHFDIYDSQSKDSVSSELRLIADATHNGAVFVCKLSSSGFSDRERSCTYGPLTVVSNAVDKNLKLSTQTSINIKDPNQNEGSSKANKCNASCPPDDPYTILYWAVACVGTTVLMFIFLTTTIISCCKYQTTSGEIVAAENSFTSCDGSEPVYVSLQRRQLPERNSMYMSVEDPNNPGNKVLMPREVFDEFYRSLSLKKREPKH